MSNVITDGDFSTASAVSDYRFSAPFSQYGVNTLYVMDQDFVIDRASFVPLAIDTPHPILSDFYLAVETPMQPVSFAGTVKWTRRYAQVPASFSHAGGTYPYAFPILYTGVTSTSRLFSKPLTVNCRVQVDFFHSSDSTTVAVIEPQRYINSLSGFDATSPYGEPVVTDPGFGVTPTIPDLSTYNSWVSGGIEIVPEASKLTPNWMGNIHMRETIYIKAR
jgi:hypothetical protein